MQAYQQASKAMPCSVQNPENMFYKSEAAEVGQGTDNSCVRSGTQGVRMRRWMWGDAGKQAGRGSFKWDVALRATCFGMLPWLHLEQQRKGLHRIRMQAGRGGSSQGGRGEQATAGG